MAERGGGGGGKALKKRDQRQKNDKKPKETKAAKAKAKKATDHKDIDNDDDRVSELFSDLKQNDEQDMDPVEQDMEGLDHNSYQESTGGGGRQLQIEPPDSTETFPQSSQNPTFSDGEPAIPPSTNVDVTENVADNLLAELAAFSLIPPTTVTQPYQDSPSQPTRKTIAHRSSTSKIGNNKKNKHRKKVEKKEQKEAGAMVANNQSTNARPEGSTVRGNPQPQTMTMTPAQDRNLHGPANAPAQAPTSPRFSDAALVISTGGDLQILNSAPVPAPAPTKPRSTNAGLAISTGNDGLQTQANAPAPVYDLQAFITSPAEVYDSQGSTGTASHDHTLQGLSSTLSQATTSHQTSKPFKLDKWVNCAKCRMCQAFTSPDDGSSVICPACGPYSHVRYCSIEHLLEDTTRHWAEDCKKYPIQAPVDKDTVGDRHLAGVPLLPNLCGIDTPERHRQAVYSASDADGDYYIFTDGDVYITAGKPDQKVWNLQRGKGEEMEIVSIEQPGLKDTFKRCLNVALFVGATNPLILAHLFLMIRDNLCSQEPDAWNTRVLYCLSYQFVREFQWQIPEFLSASDRHACPTYWNGRGPQFCTNTICKHELLNPATGRPYWFMSGSISERVDRLEKMFWLLRVARVYHAAAKDKMDRMRGAGWNRVSPGERRAFGMGIEWEGFPAGMMEVEGASWVVRAGAAAFGEHGAWLHHNEVLG